MSVAQHLGIRLADYDRRIRTFIPHYEEMLDTAASMLACVRRRRPLIVDLGIGTGALAARCLAVASGAQLVGIDSDIDILELARRRLTPLASRPIGLVHADFGACAIPRCDAIVASLALHHIPTKRRKAALYARCAEALRPGGVLVNADCCTGSAPGVRRLLDEAWRRHLVRRYSRTQVDALLRAWAGEDTYFSLQEEQDMIRRAGLHVDVAWRRGALAILVGTRKAATRR
jgi:tRNA (cmo5U34)-methyltransferase